MSSIRFRVRNTKTGEKVLYHDKQLPLVKTVDENGDFAITSIPGTSLEMYAGKDAEGNDIHVGDFVRCGDYQFKVVFENYAFRLKHEYGYRDILRQDFVLISKK